MEKLFCLSLFPKRRTEASRGYRANNGIELSSWTVIVRRVFSEIIERSRERGNSI